jgi:hypothetical protein
VSALALRGLGGVLDATSSPRRSCGSPARLRTARWPMCGASAVGRVALQTLVGLSPHYGEEVKGRDGAHLTRRGWWCGQRCGRPVGAQMVHCSGRRLASGGRSCRAGFGWGGCVGERGGGGGGGGARLLLTRRGRRGRDGGGVGIARGRWQSLTAREVGQLVRHTPRCVQWAHHHHGREEHSTWRADSRADTTHPTTVSHTNFIHSSW